jgi:hypothetical protein
MNAASAAGVETFSVFDRQQILCDCKIAQAKMMTQK